MMTSGPGVPPSGPAPGAASPGASTASRKRRSLVRGKLGALVLGVLCLALFFGGYLIAVYWMFPAPAAPTDGVVVPDLRGMSLSMARDRLAPLGLETGDTVSIPHNQTPMGLIIAQTPLPGQQARAGGSVSVGLSSGQPSVTIPNVVGYGARRAQNLLQRLGFEVSQSLEESERPNGTVLRSQPDAGNKLSLPARVMIVVSAGRPDSVVVDTLRRDSITSRSFR
ncbi:MAG: PASTA domain-containing protein [Gemmatimonadota bacterium]